MSSLGYNDLILTNHARARMMDRGITIEQIYETYKSPEVTGRAEREGVKSTRKFDRFKVTIIFKLNELKQPVILSCWMDPPLDGTRDAIKKQNWNRYKRAGFWGKIWYTLLKQVGV